MHEYGSNSNRNSLEDGTPLSSAWMHALAASLEDEGNKPPVVSSDIRVKMAENFSQHDGHGLGKFCIYIFFSKKKKMD